MIQGLTNDAMAIFDAVLASHMHAAFGPAWRSMCHQSAKVSTVALRHLYPGASVELKQVELVALMAGAARFVHIGWAEDPNRIDGKIPAHFAAVIGTGLYDPTFSQLRNVKTPLALPPEPFFYADRFFLDAPLDTDGFRWAAWEAGSGRLRIGYKIHPELHGAVPAGMLMTDEEAEAHAAAVVRQMQPRLSAKIQ